MEDSAALNTQHIEYDDFVDDADSALGQEIASSTESLNSLVIKFEYKHGRRYHAYCKGAYAFPNDEEELDRMDLHHFLSLLLFESKLHFAPLVTPQKILDLGTGTGIWVIDMADQYPSAHVIGIDLSPVQPVFVPPNVEFQVDDFELDWTFQPASFDFIHWRYLIACISNYPKMLRRASQTLKPGGWMEIQELAPQLDTDDDTQQKPSAVQQWASLFREATAKMGKPIPAIEEYEGLMRQAGFVNVKAIHFKQPGNVWPKDKRLKRIGLYTLANHLNGLSAFTVGLFTRVLGWTVDECEILIAMVKTELKDPRVHAYQRVTVVYGQKPDDKDTVSLRRVR